MRRGRAPSVPVGPGERVLAATTARDGTVLAGTRDAFYASTTDGTVSRVPWEQVEAATWDAEADRFRLTEVGVWSEPRRAHVALLDEPGRLLELVRERVTASVVLQRHVPVQGRRGVRVIARRAPRGDRPLEWVYEYDEGVDPEDPLVAQAAREALELARHDVGLP